MREDMKEDIHKILQENEVVFLEFRCHDCRVPVRVKASRDEQGMIFEPQDDAVGYYPEIQGEREYFLKCPDCYQEQPKLTDFQPVEVYTRVVGYYRPVNAWNKGKQAEYKDRKVYGDEAVTT